MDKLPVESRMEMAAGSHWHSLASIDVQREQETQH